MITPLQLQSPVFAVVRVEPLTVQQWVDGYLSTLVLLAGQTVATHLRRETAEIHAASATRRFKVRYRVEERAA